jgi:hypothetical protein
MQAVSVVALPWLRGVVVVVVAPCVCASRVTAAAQLVKASAWGVGECVSTVPNVSSLPAAPQLMLSPGVVTWAGLVTLLAGLLPKEGDDSGGPSSAAQPWPLLSFARQ